MNDSPKNVAGERVLPPTQMKIMAGIKRLATGCPLWRYRPYQEKG